MLVKQINKLIADSLKAHDEVRLSTLRMLSSAFSYEKIAKQHELSDEEELVVIRKEAKKRKDAIEAYTKAGAQDRADKEKAELAILEEYLPPQMDEAELEKIVIETIEEQGATAMKDMGKVIGAVMAKTNGQAEGGRVSELAKKHLS